MSNWHKDIVGIEPLETKHGATKSDLIVPLLSFLCINIVLSIQTHITCIVHDFDVLGIIQKIQVIGSLQDDKFFIVSS